MVLKDSRLVKIEISDKDNFGDIHDKLSILGADVVAETIGLINAGNYKLLNQDDFLASPAPKITKETGLIRWNKTADEINNLVRGLSPYPGAYFIYKNKLIKVYQSSVNKDSKLSPGEISAGKNELTIGCISGSLNVIEVQLEGKKKMHVSEFLRGFNFS
jgi:methionyl-tRNA formyltransferase